MHGDRPQAELLHLAGDERAVDAAADANGAIVWPPGTVAANRVDRCRQLPLAIGAASDSRGDEAIVGMTVVAHAGIVEGDVRVRRVHDAAGADSRPGHRAEDG